MRRLQFVMLAATTALVAPMGMARAQATQSADPPAEATANPADSPDDTQSGEVVVTGTSIRGIAPTGSAPISVDRQNIENKGLRTTAELLATVPQIAQFNQVPTGAVRFGGAVNTVSLRPNLGAGATLVLFNGHRVVPSGFLGTAVDTSNIPPVAIGRVEIVADGASAVYGSDAVGGVINFIPRRTFDGAETSARYSTARYGYDGFDLSQIVGAEWGGGSLVVSGQYIGHARLTTADLPYYSDRISSLGLNAACAPAVFTPTTPRCDAAKFGDLQPYERRGSVFAVARQELTGGIELWGDFLWGRDRRSQDEATTAFPNSPIAAANPFNPRGTAGTISYRPTDIFGTGLDRTLRFRIWQGTGGLDYDLPHGFRGTSFVSYGETNNTSATVAYNNTAYQRALLATTTATAFDPFGGRTSQAVLDQILDGLDATRVKNTLTDAFTKIDGPLFDVPGGSVRLAVGAEYRRETQVGQRRVGSPSSLLPTGTGFLVQGDADAKREITSLLGELFVPLVGEGNEMGWAKRLSISLAARYDHYSDVGGTTNPKVGIDWQIAEPFRVFANASRSFQAPNLGDTDTGSVDRRIQPFFGSSIYQPPGAAYVGTTGLIIAGGSPGLKPQTSRNWSAGAEFKSPWWSGFRALATYYHVDFNNAIQIPFPGLYSIPSLSQYAIPAPIVNGVLQPFTPTSPQVTQFTNILTIDGGVVPSQIGYIAILQRVNLARKIQGGIDFDISQTLPVGNGGRIVFGAAGSYLTSSKLSGAPGAVLTDVISTDHRFRLALQADLRTGPVGLYLAVNHLSGRYTTTAKTYRIDSINLVNARLSYQVDGVLKGTELSVNFDNLLDTLPPRQFDAAGGRNVNFAPYGRMITFGVRQRW